MRYRTLHVAAVGVLAAALLAFAPGASAHTASATSAPTTTTSAAMPAAATACANVVFLGARGSGEPGPGGSSDPQPDPDLGLGPTVYGAYHEMMARLDGRTNVKLVPLSYPADALSSVLETDYLKDLTSGVLTALDFLRSAAVRCPHQKFVLAGYSQGAMIMHRVLNTLTAGTSSDRSIVKRVRAVALIADGDRVPYDETVPTGTASPAAEGLAYVFSALSGAGTTKFSPALGSRIFSVCTKDDIVCNFVPPLVCALLRDPTAVATCVVAVLAPGVVIHLAYHGSPVVSLAGDKLAAKLLG